jgi:hypothetical protein
MTGLAPTGRVERRSEARRGTPRPAPAVARSHGSRHKVLIQRDEFRAELACGNPSTDDELVGPYEQGFAAYATGIGLADNPYPGDSCAHLHWANGWSQARDEAQRQAR